jgi:aromatic ring-opening dioxygenase catalytic subunit (LigB family)
VLTSHAYLVPHLPTLLVDEHRRHKTAMLAALGALGERLRAGAPDVVLVVSTHWQPGGPFLVDQGRRHATITDYGGFGVEVRYDCPGHPALARALIEAGLRAGVRVAGAERGVDHAVTVPLHFLFPQPVVPVVPLSMSQRPHGECRRWGEVAAETLRASPLRCAFLVSGSFAHDLHSWSLGREVPECVEFDELMLGALGRGEWSAVERVDPRLRERAKPEAELRHLAMLRGFLGGDAAGELLAYERLPAVGAALMEFGVAASGIPGEGHS